MRGLRAGTCAVLRGSLLTVCKQVRLSFFCVRNNYFTLPYLIEQSVSLASYVTRTVGGRKLVYLFRFCDSVADCRFSDLLAYLVIMLLIQIIKFCTETYAVKSNFAQTGRRLPICVCVC